MAEQQNIPQQHVDKVCKVGKGHDCCRYITMGPEGWNCEKHSSLKALLDGRVAALSMNARGDNCSGDPADWTKLDG